MTTGTAAGFATTGIENHPGHADQKSHGRKRRKAPEQLQDEATIHSTYGFHDSKTGLTAEVAHFERNGTVTTVHIQIKDQAGKVVGRASREIHAGRSEVEHSHLKLDPGFQGQGFATRYNQQAEQAYREHGIKRITLTANEDVGGYSWARAGYQFRTGAERSAVATRARSRARVRVDRPQIREEIRRVAANPNSSPIDFAMIGHTPGATTWPGKEIMLGSRWDGVKDL